MKKNIINMEDNRKKTTNIIIALPEYYFHCIQKTVQEALQSMQVRFPKGTIILKIKIKNESSSLCYFDVNLDGLVFLLNEN